MTSRRPDWERALGEYLRATSARVSSGPDVEWGSFDCAVFVGGAVEATTGRDVRRGWKRYGSLAGAYRLLTSKADGSLPKAVDAALGSRRTPVALAQRGDVGYLAEKGGLGRLGVVVGRETLFLGDGGLVRVRTLDLDLAWAVGR